MPAAGARFLVEGRVQGVCFRAATQAQARTLGLTGHARNLPDGRVEVMAFGSPVALAELAAWLRQGPPTARVDALAREDIGAQEHAGFRCL